jgi:small ligand-binding sensory domain FIST
MAAFAAGLSENPELVQAVQEAVAQVRLGLGPGGPPDLALLFVTPHHRSLVPEAAKFVRDALHPGTLLGCAAESVVGGRREVEHAPGVSLWAGRTGPAQPFHLEVTHTPDGPTITGWPDDMDTASGMLVLADPFSFPTPDFLERLDEDHRGLPLVGGMALVSPEPGDNQLVLDGEVLHEGAVGALLGAGVQVSAVVSQGCRPIGSPYVVTRAEGNVVYELGSRPPLERLKQLAATMEPVDVALLNRGVHLGLVVDEHKVIFERGDFLIRNVLGGDVGNGAIKLDDEIEVGATVQFQVRDAGSADEDLRHLVEGRIADAALLFTCSGRGRRLFRQPDHDATIVSDGLAGAPLAGMFCAGEIGPVGDRTFLHEFTASVALLTTAPAASIATEESAAPADG